MLFQEAITNNDLPLTSRKWYVVNIESLQLLVGNYKVEDIYISATGKNTTKELVYVTVHNLLVIISCTKQNILYRERNMFNIVLSDI